MIASDQPTCFPANVLVRVSSKSDGTVLDKAVGLHDENIVTNRTAFCQANGVSYGDVVFQRIVYGDAQTYDKIADVTDADTSKYISEVAADALVTSQSGVGLLLPVADCIATVIYDSASQRLALLHLGRHSTVANLMTKTIAHLAELGSKPEDLTIWMSPSVRQSDYIMEYFDKADDPQWRDYCRTVTAGIQLDLQGYNSAAAIRAGVKQNNIHVSPINTATHQDYFSHSTGDKAGRFAVLAVRTT